MKTFLLIVTSIISSSLFAQTSGIYGLIKKNDGAKINGTSHAIGFESQVIILNYTGGSDNTATIEIEVPTGAYVGELRNIMNSTAATGQPGVPAQQPIAKKPATLPSSPIKKNVEVTPAINKRSIQAQAVLLASAEISVVANITYSGSVKITNKIMLQDVQVESCTDDVSTGNSKIKLKGKRIGWTYYSYEATSGKVSNISKSGWDTVSGTAWNNF